MNLMKMKGLKCNFMSEENEVKTEDLKVIEAIREEYETKISELRAEYETKLKTQKEELEESHIKQIKALISGRTIEVETRQTPTKNEDINPFDELVESTRKLVEGK